LKNRPVPPVGRLPTALLCAAVLSSPTSLVQAQTSADIEAAARQAERIQIEARERIERQREQDLRSEEPPTRLEVPEPAPSARESTTCVDIDDVEVSGVTLLGRGAVAELEASYEARCLGVAEIERLLAEVTASYIAKGYVAARGYLPPQDLTTRRLRIEVEEGRVEEVIIKGGEGSISVRNVAPGVVGEPLNLRDLEQALDQINRLASNDATMGIVPGSEPGYSIIEFHNLPSRRWHLSATYDNYGQESTGEKQAGVNVAFDNPFGFNDFISFTHRRAQPYDTGRRASWFNNLTYVLPLGYSTLSLNASQSEYASVLDAPSGAELKTEGDSTTWSLRLDHVVWRGQQSHWNIAGTLTRKESNNYLEDIFLEVSSRRLAVFDLDSSFTTRFLGGALTLNTGVARGLSRLGALEDAPNLPDWAPQAQFTKLKYGFSFYRPFRLLDQNLSFSSQFVGQHALDTLYGSEQISIGSPYTVRGYSDNALNGDHGHYFSNELSLLKPLDFASGRAVLLRPFLRLDYGKVWNRAADIPEGELSSASVGLGLHMGNVRLDILHAHPIDQPEFATDEGDTTYLTFSLAL
jgi:hemolysin activation/secretion protein